MFVVNKNTLSPLRGVELHPRCRITLFGVCTNPRPILMIFSYLSQVSSRLGFIEILQVLEFIEGTRGSLVSQTHDVFQLS